MEKLKELFHKLRTTEINLKDLKLSSVKDKLKNIKLADNTQQTNIKFNIKNLKNISLQDIKTFDYKNFYIQHKQQILTVFVVIMSIFFLFYWTNLFLSSKLASSIEKADNTYKKMKN